MPLSQKGFYHHMCNQFLGATIFDITALLCSCCFINNSMEDLVCTLPWRHCFCCNSSSMLHYNIIIKTCVLKKIGKVHTAFYLEIIFNF
jgi:hypothetical protein